MAAIGGNCFAITGLSPPRTTFLCTSPPQLPPSVRVAVNAHRHTCSSTRAGATTTTTSSGLSPSTAHDDDTRIINGERVISSEDEEDDDDDGKVAKNLRDYFELAKNFVRSDGGPPRWFSPLETGRRMPNSPLLLYLPGLDGLGLGLVNQQRRLGKIFDIWCLHIPVKDRTSFQELVLLVEQSVRLESHRSPGRPIYLVGESIGGCLALAVAARNPDIELVLILANPATSYRKSQLQPLLPLLETIPNELSLINIPYTIGLMTGEPFNLVSSAIRNATLDQFFKSLGTLSSYVSVLAEILPRDTLIWKLQMMKSASLFANSRLHAVKAQILILASGNDPLLPNLEEAERILGALPKQEVRVLKSTGKLSKCDIRKFENSGHFLFLEQDVDLVTIIKGTSFYRHAKFHDYVSDYMPPTKAEFKKASESFR